MFKLNLKNFILFCFVWGVTGFVLGTGLLMGPSRWVIDLARNNPDLASIEEPAVRALILLLVAVSLSSALYVTRTLLRTPMRHIRFGVPFLLIIFLMASLYMWFNPKKFGNASTDQGTETERFSVGSYPDLKKLEQLKEDGYTGVISLLHPAVMPFETSLISQEATNAEKAGIDLIHLPMLPWISENKDSLSQLHELAATPGGKYYLHCYLGKDRVSVALKTIADADPSVADVLGQRARKLSLRRTLERGRVFMPANGIFLVPYPTHEEYFTYIVGANITNVVCLMNPEEGDSTKIITRSEEILREFKISQINVPIARETYDADAVRRAVDTVKALDGQVVVFDFRCPSFRTEAFVQAYRDARPPLPPSLVSDDLLVGPVQQIAPNVLIGARPDNLKKFVELEEMGIKRFLFVAASDSPESVRDRELARVAGFDWRNVSMPATDALVDMLSEGGPWYVYGSMEPAVLSELGSRMGPAYKEPADHVAAQEAAELPEDRAGQRFSATLQNVREHRGPESLNPVKVLYDFALHSAPTPKLMILFAPFCLLYTYICGAYAGWLRVKKGVRTPYTRKVFHFLIFTMACLVQLKGGIQSTVLFGTITCCCVLYAILRGDGFPFYEAMARPTDAPHRSLYIFVPMVTTALGGVIANIFFQPAAVIGYLVGGWGDAVGEPAGTRWGKHKYKVHSLLGVPATRSLEGSAAVMVASFLAAALGLLLMGAPLGLTVAAAMLCAIAVGFTEALSTHGMDNLTVQIVGSAVVYFLLRMA